MDEIFDASEKINHDESNQNQPNIDIPILKIFPQERPKRSKG